MDDEMLVMWPGIATNSRQYLVWSPAWSMEQLLHPPYLDKSLIYFPWQKEEVVNPKPWFIAW